jgi:hypothetical protein
MAIAVISKATRMSPSTVYLRVFRRRSPVPQRIPFQSETQTRGL